MRAFLCGLGCVAVFVGATYLPNLWAQEGEADALAEFEKPLRVEEPAKVLTAEQRIRSVLDAPLKAAIDYDEQPLEEIVEILQDEYDIPIRFDNAALDELAISPATEVTLHLRDVKLRTAFDLMLRQPGLEDLTTIVADEVLLITTKEVAAGTLSIRLYRIDDMQVYADRVKDEFGNITRSLARMVDVITTTVEADSWQSNGTGDGKIMLLSPGVLVVTQTQAVHEKIEALLADLRSVAKDIESSSSADQTSPAREPSNHFGRF